LFAATCGYDFFRVYSELFILFFRKMQDHNFVHVFFCNCKLKCANPVGFWHECYASSVEIDFFKCEYLSSALDYI